MGNITEHGYGLLRTHIIADWKYLELQTPTGTPLKRFTTSNGLVITGTSNNATIEYKVVTTGAMAEFKNKTVGKSVLYSVVSGGQPIATETFAEFTFTQNEDELTVKHVLEVPKVI